MSPGGTRPTHLPLSVGISRYEEAAHHRSELDMVKRENDGLRRRVKELEKSLSNIRSDVGRTRSDSASTGNSLRVNPSINAMDDDDDAVNVGESAGSVGLGGGR